MYNFMIFKIFLKKQILVLSLFLLFCLNIFSCSENHSLKVQNDKLKPVNIIFDISSNMKQKELFSKLADNFNQTNDYNIFVTLSSDENTLSAQVDCALLSSAEAQNYYKKDKIVDLSLIIKDSKWGLSKGKKFFSKAILKQIEYGFFEKRITSIPLFIDAHFMLYNKDLLNEIGYARLPRSWFRFNFLIRKASKKIDNVLGFVYNFDNFTNIVQSRGGLIIQPSGLNYNLNNPVVINTIWYLNNLEKKKILSPNNLYSNQTAFAFGNLLFAITEISSIDHYAKLIDAVNPNMNWDTELLVTRKPGDNIVLSCKNNAVIMKGLPEKEFSSWLFIKWLLQPEQQKQIVESTKSLPASLSLIPEIKQNNSIYLSTQWLNAVRLAYFSHKEAMPYMYDYKKVSILFDETLKEIRNGKNIIWEIIKLEYTVKKQRRNDNKYKNYCR